VVATDIGLVTELTVIVMKPVEFIVDVTLITTMMLEV
jgi:hypothetical protein